ncbi:hypothetical protein [Leifsonia sp. P73]|uniref:hypothetical protein n=1 Tax=Leifsonia sp. P73 TaxID=3423959 RepID=UPI003DA59621
MSSTTFGPEALPYPQPSDAPDGPGAFLALIQKLVLGGVQQFGTYAALPTPNPSAGVGFGGQLAIVTADPNPGLNGIYESNGTAWSLILSPTTAAWTPTVGNVATSAVQARYSVAAGIAFCSGKITISAAPTGAPTITLPLTATVGNNGKVLGTAIMNHSSGASIVDAFAFLNDATHVGFTPKFSSGTPAYVQQGVSVDSTHPFAWAAGDTIEFEFQYNL